MPNCRRGGSEPRRHQDRKEECATREFCALHTDDHRNRTTKGGGAEDLVQHSDVHTHTHSHSIINEDDGTHFAQHFVAPNYLHDTQSFGGVGQIFLGKVSDDWIGRWLGIKT